MFICVSLYCRCNCHCYCNTFSEYYIVSIYYPGFFFAKTVKEVEYVYNYINLYICKYIYVYINVYFMHSNI